uniref:Uncharacterized protein n=1 Tax=Arundo donax TaxID=35708 RepID=A0A0A9HIW6_ARUDO
MPIASLQRTYEQHHSVQGLLFVKGLRDVPCPGPFYIPSSYPESTDESAMPLQLRACAVRVILDRATSTCYLVLLGCRLLLLNRRSSWLQECR